MCLLDLTWIVARPVSQRHPFVVDVWWRHTHQVGIEAQFEYANEATLAAFCRRPIALCQQLNSVDGIHKLTDAYNPFIGTNIAIFRHFRPLVT